MSVPLATAAPTPEIAAFFKALGDETRLTIMRVLALTDLRSGEIVERLDVPHNAASYHLKHLRTLGLLRDRRSSADARDVYYSIDLGRLQSLYAAAGAALYIPAPGTLETASDRGSAFGGPAMPARVAGDRPLRVLFLCTHNSARSQLAEGILRTLGGETVEVSSAGSEPTEVHPVALTLLREWGIDTTRVVSKRMDQFTGQYFDYIVTVCDRVREHCPIFPGDPHQMHWSVPDPVSVEGEEQQWAAFQEVQCELVTRVRYLLNVQHPVLAGQMGRET